MNQKQKQSDGFTMIELLVALMIASIVLAAVATLASATAAANSATDQMGREQSQLRQVSMRLADLIRRANRVTVTDDDKFTLWHDINADGLKTGDELTKVKRVPDTSQLMIGGGENYNQCENISFAYDNAFPDTQFITVSFDVSENGQLQNHSVSARLRVSDEHRKF
jgi:prepilin-type N-terminal cleavage/methylation domain-containing protein